LKFVRKKLRKEQSLENLSLVDRSVKDLTLTMQKFEEKEKQEGTYNQPKLSRYGFFSTQKLYTSHQYFVIYMRTILALD
jgi:hypothetical protein